MIKFDRFTQKAREALETAQAALAQLSQSQLDSEHLLYGITFVDGSLMDGILSQALGEAEAAEARQRRRVQEPLLVASGACLGIHTARPLVGAGTASSRRVTILSAVRCSDSA